MSILGFITGSDSINKAAHDTNKAYRNAAALTTQGWDKASGILSPGANYMPVQNKLWDLLGLNGAQGQQDAFGQYQESPGVAFMRNQGEQSLERAAAAGGGLASGRTLADANTFGQGVAEQGYGDYFSRLQDLFRSAKGTASDLASGYTGNASRLSDLALGRGQASANYTMQKGAIVPNLITGGLGIGADLLGNYLGKPKTASIY